MSCRTASVILTLAAALLTAPTANAQFTVLVTDFEDGAWTSFVTQVMFQNPSTSGSTTGLDPLISDLTYLTDTNLDPFSVHHSPQRAAATFWGWANSSAHRSWVRLTTSDAEVLPNPAVHLEGTVRFWAAASAYTDGTFGTPVAGGNLFLGIGVRETGQGVAQGGNGGTSGTIELAGAVQHPDIIAGVNLVCDTTVGDVLGDDVFVGDPTTVCVDSGIDGILDTVPVTDDTTSSTPRGICSIPGDRVMRLYEFNFLSDMVEVTCNGATTVVPVVPFSGDGTLFAEPSNRGTLEHLLLANDPNNGAVNANVWLVNVDDVEFEAPALDPPRIQDLPDPAPQPLDETVMVLDIHPMADLVEVLKLVGGVESLLGSIDPLGATSFAVPTTPLPSGAAIVARQTVAPDTSDNSTPVIVAPDGNGVLRIAMAIRETDAFDHGLPCGADGTGFDPNQPSTLEFVGASGTSGFGVPDGRRFAPTPGWFNIVFDPCDAVYGVTAFSGDGVLNLNAAPDFTDGVWEGLYFRIDDSAPRTGPYTVFLDDLEIVNGAGPGINCVLDDFESYTPGDHIIGDFDGDGLANTLAEATDVQVVPVGTTIFGGEIIVSPGGDGTLETAPQGDDLFSPMRARFNTPSVAGTSVGLAPTPDLTAISDEAAHSGVNSLKVEFAFAGASNLNSHLRLTSNGPLTTTVPETYLHPDSVVRLSNDGTFCDTVDDLAYSVWVLLAPPEVPGDSDADGDVDLEDFGNFDLCINRLPILPECVFADLAPNGAPAGVIDLADFELFWFLMGGPVQ
ncbi:MAG: hypothetical protein GY778_21990 [bacterium]|nr:hypothetical protein [bacterium]